MVGSEEYENLITTFGVSVEGSSGVGLPRRAALEGVAILRRAGVPIVGGDVCRQHDGRVVHTYDNWCVDPQQLENREAYFLRSWDESESYIRKYPGGDDVLFAIVLADPAGVWPAGSPHA